MWPIFLIIFSFFCGTSLEILTNVIATKIQSKTRRKFFYWIVFTISRLCIHLGVYFVANLIEMIERSLLFVHISLTDDHDKLAAFLRLPLGGFCVFFCLNSFLLLYIYSTFLINHYWLYPLIENILIFEDKPKTVWCHKLKFKSRHIHLPMRDIFNWLPLTTIIRILKLPETNEWLGHFLAPCRRDLYTVITLDFDKIDDPTWPDRSLIHFVGFFSCGSCPKDRGLYLVTTSILRRKSWTTFIGRSDTTDLSSYNDRFYIKAVQSGGLIFVFVTQGLIDQPRKHELFMYNMRNGEKRWVDLSSTFLDICWPIYFLPDDGSDWYEDRDPASIYLRTIYMALNSTQFPFVYGQCLLQISINNQVKKIKIKEIDFPHSYIIKTYHLFWMSNKLGICFAFEESNERRHIFIVYDLKSRQLMSTGNIKPILLTDRPIRPFAQRYSGCYDLTWLQGMITHKKNRITSSLCLTEREAMFEEKEYGLWTTRFQPPTLKYISLGKAFETFGKFSVQDWKKVLGDGLDVHFPVD